MNLTQLPGNLNLFFIPGDSFTFTVQPSISLAGVSLAAFSGTMNFLIVPSVGMPTGYSYDISLTAAQTALILGSATWELQWTVPGGSVRTILQGNLYNALAVPPGSGTGTYSSSDPIILTIQQAGIPGMPARGKIIPVTFASEDTYVEVACLYVGLLSTDIVSASFSDPSGDVAGQNMTCGVLSQTPGIGFSIWAAAPDGATGTYNVNAIIATQI
jgi:hypothetical protein